MHFINFNPQIDEEKDGGSIQQHCLHSFIPPDSWLTCQPMNDCKQDPRAWDWVVEKIKRTCTIEKLYNDKREENANLKNKGIISVHLVTKGGSVPRNKY